MWARVVLVLLAGVPACRVEYSTYGYYETDAENDHSDDEGDFYDIYVDDVDTDPTLMSTAPMEAVTMVRRYEDLDELTTMNSQELQYVTGPLKDIIFGRNLVLLTRTKNDFTTRTTTTPRLATGMESKGKERKGSEFFYPPFTTPSPPASENLSKLTKYSSVVNMTSPSTLPGNNTVPGNVTLPPYYTPYPPSPASKTTLGTATTTKTAAETVPSKKTTAKTEPSNKVTTKTVPSNETTAKTVPSNETTVKTEPSNKITAKTVPSNETTTADNKTKSSKTTPETPGMDINAILAIIANLTYDYDWNLTEQFNKTLIEHGVPTCPTESTPTTTSTTPSPYDFANTSVVGKCFVCGLKTLEIPRAAFCADAFAGDFLPLVPIDPRARGQIATFRKYCRYLDVHNYVENPSEPRSIYGRFTGGCGVRWTDLSGVYTQRTCRAKFRPLMGKHFASKRMAKLELALINVENGCIISPMATLLPLSRGISLYARFHACVCTGSWCNAAREQRAGEGGLTVTALALGLWLTTTM